MTHQDFLDRFFHALHELVGICGHCGKKGCAGRKSHSVLPAKIDRESIIAATVNMKRKRS